MRAMWAGVGVVVLSVGLGACAQAGGPGAGVPTPSTSMVTVTTVPVASTPTGGASSSPTTSAPTAPAAQTPTPTQPQAPPQPQALPRIKVVGGEGEPAPASVQRFADDVADGAIDSVIHNCWTRAPSSIRKALSVSGRQAILAKLQTPMHGAQGGWYWGPSQKSVFFPWSEVHSSYACPDLSSELELTREEVALLLARLDGRRQGTPIRPSDTASNYHLVCEFSNTLGVGGTSVEWESDVAPAAWSALRTVAAGPIKTTTGQGVRVTPASASRPVIVFREGVGGWCWESATP